MRSDRTRLEDARVFIAHAHAGVRGLGDEGSPGSPASLHAVIYALVVVGETLGKLSAEVRNLAPEVPWRAIKDMRNRLVHGYWTVDPTIVARVVEHDLPPLDRRLADLLRQLEAGGA